MVQVLNVLNDIVIQLKFLQLLHAFEIVDLPDVLVRKLKVLQIPNDWLDLLALVVDEEDAVLLVVLYSIITDQRIVDDRRLHGLLLLLVVGLGLEDLTDLLRHGLLNVDLLHFGAVLVF